MTSHRLAGIALAVLFSALARPASADPTLECPGGSQVEIKACLAETEERVDQALRVAYEIAMRQAVELDAVMERDMMAPALEAGQTAWIAYRDAHCAFVGATFGGGSGTGAGIRACRIDLGRARADTLLGAF